MSQTEPVVPRAATCRRPDCAAGIGVRRRLLVLAPLALATLWPAPARASGGLAERARGLLAGPKSRLVVVLVDTTGSVASEDWRLYESSLNTVLEALRPGDRIVLAEVADQPASRFIAHADHRLVSAGNSLHDKARARRTREAALADFTALRTARTRPARATLLFDTVLATAELFAQGRAAGQALQLVLLSDMVEEGRRVSFAQAAPRAEAAARMLDGLRRDGLLPDLTGVRVHVVGASGRDAAHMAAIHAFWRSYFEAAGAELRAYGRSASGAAP